MRDRVPQPASAAMAEETADWYVKHTGGQLRKALHEDGNWYLYSPAPAEADWGTASSAQTADIVPPVDGP